MTRRALNVLAMVLIGIIAVVSTQPALASRPVKPDKFAFDSNSGYILMRMAPRPRGAKTIIFAQLDPDHPGTTLWRFGMKDAVSDKTRAAAIAYYAANWGEDAGGAWVLLAVPPGRWVIAGVDDAGLSTSLSLGSYAFDIKAGEISYIGTVGLGAENGNSGVPEIDRQKLSDDLVHFGTMMNLVMSYSIAWRPPAPDDHPPAALAAYKIVQPQAIADVRFNNVMRGLVTRAATLPPPQHAVVK